MELTTLIKKIEPVAIVGDNTVEITGVNIDSRRIQPGHLFVAIKGTQVDGHSFIQKAIDLNRRQAYEGSVLLKNENNVLPLASGANVTLLGIRSHKPVLGSAFGVKVWGPVINLEQALRDNRTDFAHTISDSASTNWQTGETTIAPTMDGCAACRARARAWSSGATKTSTTTRR